MTQPSPDAPVLGSCLCGGVRFEVTQPFDRAAFCHCSRCRKLTGALAAPTGVVAREGFELLAGEELLGVYRPGEGVTPALFCKTCGSTLFRSWWPPRQVVAIRLGSLDTDPGIAPAYHSFVDSRPRWDEVPDDGLPRYAERRPSS